MEKFIGLSLSSGMIKSVLMRKEKERFVLEDFHLVELKQAEGEERKRLLTEGLKAALKKFESGNARLICALDGQGMQHIHLVMPQMPPKEMHDAVAWEIKNQNAMPQKDLIFDYKVQNEFEDKNLKKVKLSVTVARKASVDETKDLLLQAGFRPDAILSGDAALELFFARQRKKMGEASLAILDVGDDLTELFIYKKGNLEFTRKLPSMTVNEMAKTLTAPLVTPQGKVQLTLAEAREMLLQHGIPAPGMSEPIAGKISATQMMSLLRPKLEQLKTEIERSFDYFRETLNENIQRIVLFENRTNIKGLAEYLHKELETPIERGQLSDEIAVETKDHQGDLHRLHAAIGAVLSEGRWINLLSEETAEREKNLVQRMSVIAGFSVAVFVLALSLFFLWNERNMLQGKLHERQDRLKGLLQQFDEIEEEKPMIEEVFRHPYWDQVFKELSNLIPEKMTIVELSMQDNVIRFKGRIEKASGQETEGLLSAFMITLEEKMFKNVHLIESRDDDKDSSLTQFEIVSSID